MYSCTGADYPRSGSGCPYDGFRNWAGSIYISGCQASQPHIAKGLLFSINKNCKTTASTAVFRYGRTLLCNFAMVSGLSLAGGGMCWTARLQRGHVIVGRSHKRRLLSPFPFSNLIGPYSTQSCSACPVPVRQLLMCTVHV